MKLFLFTTWATLLISIIYQLYFKPEYRTMKGQKIADFSQVVGNVTYKPAGSLSRLPAKGNDSIFEMDMIYTGNKSKASLIFADGSILDIAPNSQLKIAPKKDFNNEISISLLPVSYTHLTLPTTPYV